MNVSARSKSTRVRFGSRGLVFRNPYNVLARAPLETTVIDNAAEVFRLNPSNTWMMGMYRGPPPTPPALAKRPHCKARGLNFAPLLVWTEGRISRMFECCYEFSFSIQHLM